MKNFFIALFVLFSAIQSFAKSPISITFLPASRVEIKGNSTLKKFSAVAKQIDIIAKAEEKPSLRGRLPWTPTELEMSLAVKNLKSDSETLDDHMHENLKAGKFPQIQLKLSAFKFTEEATVTATGRLIVAGVAKPIELKAIVTVESQNIRIQGTKMVLMSDFEIQPPAMLMGTLKTRNEIEVIFDVICLLNDKKKG